MNKSEAAFRMSADRLFEESSRVYFWTFTFTEVWDDWVYSRQWTRFWKRFTDQTNFFVGGLKVVELHPGGHGIHYHCLLNHRLPVGEIRRIGRKFGIGRVHVVRADTGTIGYLGNYLTKPDDGLSKGIRRWSCVGHFQGVKATNVEVESEFTSRLRMVKGDRKLTWVGYQIARREYVRTGRVSIATVTNNLHRPKLAQYERMLAEGIIMRKHDEVEDDGSSDFRIDEVTRYRSKPRVGTRMSIIIEVLGVGPAERDGRVVGMTATAKQACLVCQFLNQRIKNNSYTV